MTWGKRLFLNVKIAWNGPRNASVRNVLVEFGEGGSFTLLRIPETELNTVAKYDSWARTHHLFGPRVINALWHFLNTEYRWT
jgi:hypothetical protein